MTFRSLVGERDSIPRNIRTNRSRFLFIDDLHTIMKNLKIDQDKCC